MTHARLGVTVGCTPREEGGVTAPGSARRGRSPSAGRGAASPRRSPRRPSWPKSWSAGSAGCWRRCRALAEQLVAQRVFLAEVAPLARRWRRARSSALEEGRGLARRGEHDRLAARARRRPGMSTSATVARSRIAPGRGLVEGVELRLQQAGMADAEGRRGADRQAVVGRERRRRAARRRGRERRGRRPQTCHEQAGRSAARARLRRRSRRAGSPSRRASGATSASARAWMRASSGRSIGARRFGRARRRRASASARRLGGDDPADAAGVGEGAHALGEGGEVGVAGERQRRGARRLGKRRRGDQRGEREGDDAARRQAPAGALRRRASGRAGVRSRWSP